MAIQEKLYTADDLWQMSHGENEKRYELVKGTLVYVAPSADEHTELISWINYLFMDWVVKHDLGVVTSDSGGFILFTDPDTVRAPDVGFISKARLKPKMRKFYSMAPDLAVEIVSPNDTAREVREKVAEYLRAGTRLVVVIYPESKLIDAYNDKGKTRNLKMGDTLDLSDVLPGLSISVEVVFQRLRE